MLELLIPMQMSTMNRVIAAIAVFLLAYSIISPTLDPARKTNRFIYGLVVIATTSATLSAPGFFSLLSPDNLVLAFLSWALVTASMQVILCYFAVRRANDIYGHGTNAFMALIPLINLILIFKKPLDRTRLDNRSSAAFWGRLALFVALIIPVAGVASLPRIFQANPSQQKPANLSTASIREVALFQAYSLNQTLPDIITNSILMAEATVTDTVLQISYDVFNPLEENEALFQNISNNTCVIPLFRILLDRGGSIVHHFISHTNTSNRKTHDITVSAADCRS